MFDLFEVGEPKREKMPKILRLYVESLCPIHLK